MMYVCPTCTVLQFTGDYSSTDWSAERAEEIAEILIDEDPLITVYQCLGCGEPGGDFYRAGYWDDSHGELVTN